MKTDLHSDGSFVLLFRARDWEHAWEIAEAIEEEAEPMGYRVHHVSITRATPRKRNGYWKGYGKRTNLKIGLWKHVSETPVLTGATARARWGSLEKSASGRVPRVEVGA